MSCSSVEALYKAGALRPVMSCLKKHHANLELTHRAWYLLPKLTLTEHYKYLEAYS